MIMKNLMLWVSLVGKKKPLKNRISSKKGDEAGALIEHFLKGIKYAVKAMISYIKKEDLYSLLFSFGLMHQMPQWSTSFKEL